MKEAQHIREYLERCREIAGFTSQNGWIDNDTLRFELLERGEDEALIYVEFDEVLMEGAGCVAGRVPCYGRLRLRLDRSGRVSGSRPL